jgi:hypothetical protein
VLAFLVQEVDEVRRAAVFVVAMLAMLLPTSAAQADYGPFDPTIGVAPTPTAGSTFTVFIIGFCPGVPVTITIDDPVGSPVNVGTITPSGPTGAGSLTVNLILFQTIGPPPYTIKAKAIGSVACTITLVGVFPPVASLAPVPAAAPAVLASAIAAPADTGAGGAGLPVTGGGSLQPVQLGVVASLTGLGLIAVATFRRRSAHAVRA